MKILDQFSQQIAAFPAPLRELVTAELKAGNTIVAIENGFPAAPCGASIKLAQAVRGQRRKSVGKIKFYARNSSNYAGEFTTDERHFFVLEPPLPPESEPDMDVIREAAGGKPDALTQFAQTRPTSSASKLIKQFLLGRDVEPAKAPRRSLTFTETATGAKRLLHFQDRRPPHEIQFELERNLMTLFTAAMKNDRLIITAGAKVVGLQYDFELRFEAARPLIQCYSLRVETCWAETASAQHDYYRHASDSWFSHWTRDFLRVSPPAANAISSARYQKICALSLNAEAHLDTVAAIQHTIIVAMKRGARFTTSDKEGGSNISWNGERFVRLTYGDYPAGKLFSSDAQFLSTLRQYYDWETSRNIYPDKVSDFVAWKLILRLLRT